MPSDATQLTRILARMSPAILGVIDGAPAVDPGPPRARYLAASVRAAREVVRTAFTAKAFGSRPAPAVDPLITRWCGASAQPWPFADPFPWREEDPQTWWPVIADDPEAIAAGRLVGALVLARAAARGDGEIAAALGTAAEHLVEASLAA